MTEKEKMLAGLPYDPSDPELSALLVKARKLARRYNQIDEDESERREADITIWSMQNRSESEMTAGWRQMS